MFNSLLGGQSHRSYYIIVGCGRLGSELANALSEEGHSIVVIDEREQSFSKLSQEFGGYTITGSAVELDTLKKAGIDEADVLFAVTTHDNTNLMVAQVAREMFGVQRVVARVFDPSRDEHYAERGIATVSPTRLSAQALLNESKSEEQTK